MTSLLTSSSNGAGILKAAIDKLSQQPALLDLKCGTLAVLGDTHGYPEVTEWFLRETREFDCRIILGDLVDRGPRGVENLELVLNEIVETSNTFLLRGNHESILMNRYYGFMSEALEKRGREYLDLVRELYRVIPFAAISYKHGIFLVHGGIPCRLCHGGEEDPVSIEEISYVGSTVKGKSEADEPSNPLLFQLLWNDPDPLIDWFSPNIRGEGTFYYGVAAWSLFLTANMLSLIIRAHETVNGVLVYRSDRSSISKPREPLALSSLENSVITVFSSLYHGKSSGALLIREGLLEPIYYKSVDNVDPRPSRGGGVPPH